MLKADEIRMLRAIDQDSSFSIDDTIEMWRDETGRNDAEAVISNLEARDLIILDHDIDMIMLSERGASTFKRFKGYLKD